MESIKEKIIKAIESLPDNCSYEQIIEKIFIMEQVEKGLQDIEEGKLLKAEDVFEKYLKK